jgi:hypothetical protein
VSTVKFYIIIISEHIVFFIILMEMAPKFTCLLAVLLQVMRDFVHQLDVLDLFSLTTWLDYQLIEIHQDLWHDLMMVKSFDHLLDHRNWTALSSRNSIHLRCKSSIRWLISSARLNECWSAHCTYSASSTEKWYRHQSRY